LAFFMPKIVDIEGFPQNFVSKPDIMYSG
jgi:hypothetical protein